MRLTKNSELLMSFFLERKCIQNIEQTHKTDIILEKLYHEIKNADHYIKHLKETQREKFYNIKITKILNIHQIPSPSRFTADSFPDQVRNHIKETATVDLLYTFSLFDKNIKVHFILEESYKLSTYNKYIDSILMWLYILNNYASKDCAKEITVYFYMTSLKKNLPKSNIHILNETHVNTAFTTTCPVVSEIIIFRKEEWFKVFIHETFHNFGLDFSDMNNNRCIKKILSLFEVQSDVNLYEAYTECWAKILNALFCSYFILKKDDIKEFLSNAEFFINFERQYSFFQMVKVLEFMGLTYKDLYSKTHISSNIRKTLYKEDTNVLSYYIINLILLNNYQGFLNWCNTNNLNILQFKKTIPNQDKFCEFIEKNYKSKSLLEGVNCMEKFVKKINKLHKNIEANKELQFLVYNTRMSICELG
jgi:hypothetical protein